MCEYELGGEIVKRTFLLVLGIFSTALACVGIVLPLLPTTPFALLAAWCFMRSSPRAHAWIYGHKILGKALNDWQSGGVIAVPTKCVAFTTVLFSLIIIWSTVANMFLSLAVTTLLLGVSLFIALRPSVVTKNISIQRVTNLDQKY